MVRDTGIRLKLSVMTQNTRYLTGTIRYFECFSTVWLLPVLPGGGAAGTGRHPGREFPDPDPEIPAGTHL